MERVDVNYKNQKRYKTAKYPIRQPKFFVWLIWILAKFALIGKKYKIEKIIYSTYQSCSGGGKEELHHEHPASAAGDAAAWHQALPGLLPGVSGCVLCAAAADRGHLPVVCGAQLLGHDSGYQPQ